MIVIKSDKAAFFDVDQTIVLMDDIDYSSPALHRIRDLSAGIDAYVIPHEPILRKMKDHYARGHTIFVWSAGGYKWAKAVVESLGIDYMVYAIIPKGPWIWDDKEPNEFLDRCYIAPESSKK